MGAYHTTALLVRAHGRGALPGLNGEVGQGFGNNGGASFMHLGMSETSGAHQGSFGCQALLDLGNALSPVLVEHAQFPVGTECNCLLNVGMALDPGRGSITYDPATERASLTWPTDANARAIAAMNDLATRVIAALGGGITGSAGPLSFNGVMGRSCYQASPPRGVPGGYRRRTARLTRPKRREPRVRHARAPAASGATGTTQRAAARCPRTVRPT
jgi:hypothetical protein